MAEREGVWCRPEGQLVTSGVAVTLEALRVGIHLSEAAASGCKLSPADQQAAENVLHIPAVAQVRSTEVHPL